MSKLVQGLWYKLLGEAPLHILLVDGNQAHGRPIPGLQVVGRPTTGKQAINSARIFDRMAAKLNKLSSSAKVAAEQLKLSSSADSFAMELANSSKSSNSFDSREACSSTE